MMFEAKRLHPVAIVLNALKVLKDAFLPLLALVLFQGGGDSSSYMELIWIGIYLAGSILYGIVSWFTFTYRVEEGEIRIDQGVFVKKRRYIRLERIQSIDVTEGILQQLFSLAKISIDTAGSSKDEAEAVLSAIPKEEAAMFQALLKEAKNGQESGGQGNPAMQEEAEVKVLFGMSFKELLLMAATSGAVGVVFSGAVALVSQFGEFIDFNQAYSRIESMIAIASTLLFLLLIAAGLLFAYVIATIGVVLKYAYFTVKKSGNEIIITRGLLERRQFTISSRKIQAIRVVENLIRQPLGYATVYVETASGSVSDSENAKVMLFPLIKKSRLKAALSAVTEEYVVDMPKNNVPKRALKRYVFRECFWWALISGALIYFFRPLGYASLFLIVLGAAWGYLSYRAAGWNITDRQLTLMHRGVSKHTYIVRKPRIQSFSTKQSWFQRRNQLGTVLAYSQTGLGPSVGKAVDLEERDMLAIKRWFQKSG